MSHFVTLVLVPKSSEITDTTSLGPAIELQVENLLDPYDENLEVDPYNTACYCIGSKAKKEAEQTAIDLVGTIDSFRKRYYDIPEDSDRPNWKDFIAPFITAEKNAFEEHPLKALPDASCHICSGTGVYETTYNPVSKWDWYVIGGRWGGYLVDYDPTTEAKNYSVCWLCNGTGTRTDMVCTNGCNGCQGTGNMLKFASEIGPHPQDVLPTPTVLSIIEKDPSKVPYSLVTPDGIWHQQGRMGWFGMSEDEVSDSDWEQEVKSYLAANPDTITVVCDLHI